MASDLEQLFARFEDRAAHLNAASDSLSSTLREVESRLRSANLGLEVWLDSGLSAEAVEAPSGVERTIVHRLGWSKLDGEWSLAVKPVLIERGFFEGDTSAPYRAEEWAGEASLLGQTSRGLRVAALAQLPDLIEAMAVEAEACISTIAGAKSLTTGDE